MRTLRYNLTLIYWALIELKWYFTIPVVLFLALFRRRRQIVSVWPESGITLAPKVVLFMHFDRSGRVRAQILDYVKALRAGGRSVVFITNAGRLTPDAMAALRALCTGVIVRRNQGYDFGAWCDAVEHLGLPRADTQEVIFANDSVFGPLAPLDDMLASLDYGKADIWGLTESWQFRYHLQSFFMAFGPKALHAPAFRKFWDGIKPVPWKNYIVRYYEIGITQQMVKAGLSCSAVWPYLDLVAKVDFESFDDLISKTETDTGKVDPILRNRRLQAVRLRDAIARRIALNPSADLWRQLLMSGFPFIKRELLRDNPTSVEDVGDWVNTVREALGADPEPIVRDLKLMLKDRAP